MVRRKQPKSPPPVVPQWQATRTTDKEQGQLVQVHKIGASEVVVQTRKYRLITPLFGGGVVAGVNDPDNLIRPTGIRGQLRFWWRATYGWQCGADLVALKSREDRIWGTASLTSHEPEESAPEKPGYKAVHIMVEVMNKGDAIKPFVINNQGRLEGANDIPEYAAFPLQPEKETIRRDRQNTPINTVSKDVTFVLTLIFAREIWQEVQNTLWAWETFGGVGARTRRGFGALKLEEIDGQAVSNDYFPPAQQIAAEGWLTQQISQRQPEESNQITGHIPYLANHPQIALIGPYKDAFGSWNALIERLKKFRQRRFNFKTHQYSDFGKSLWPEGNALRRRLYPKRNMENIPDKFPRSAFGLPIVFHLPHDDEAGKPSITLQGPSKETERLASPLIIKPIPCQGRQFLGLAIILHGPDLPGDTLAFQRDIQAFSEEEKTILKDKTQIQTGELSPLLDVLNGETNILVAFLKYLKRR
jgi:CRISPR-associated protein Cmr1